MTSSLLSSTQRYAAGALFGLALHEANIHQLRPLGLHYAPEDDGETIDRISSGSRVSGSSDEVSEQPKLWVSQHSGLLRPVFRVLEIGSDAWDGLEETAGITPAKDHVGAFIRLLCLGGEESSEKMEQQRMEQEIALAKAIDIMAASMEENHISKSKLEKQRKYKHERREKFAIPQTSATSTERNIVETLEDKKCPAASNEDVSHSSGCTDKELMEEGKLLSYERKLVVLYELLSACLANAPEEVKSSKKRSGYDARHRVALRVLAIWLNIKFVKLEAMETMIACSAMALLKQEEINNEDIKSEESSWKKWKRGGIIGAAALTGGTLLAITGGLAAPAIAAGFSAMAPTLGTILPAIGASGFAAAATAAGSAAGSAAIAASFGAAGAGLTGTKMARRTGSVDEFDFKDIGENHKQGRLAVGIFISGFVFDEEDFIMAWEGLEDNLERYALQWESENLIAVSTAIQDWLTSRVALELMKQGAMMTVLSTLLTALAWPAALLSATDFIDSKWAIAIDRSDKAGKLLAEVLMKGLQGNRPVTLVGYSLGARVIFKCLQFLAEAEQSANMVERVVLLGMPIPIKDENWEAARKVVAGRFVNVYASNDWMLGVAFRASLLTKGLAGIQPVNVPGIENVDVTDIIEGHSSYLWASHQILEELELESYYPVFRSPPKRSKHPA